MKHPWMVRPKHAEAHLQKLRDDPVYFVREMFQELDLLRYGEILEVEADMIRWAALGPPRRGVLAYRGFGKTWMLTASLTCWNLFRDPDWKILIPSKSGGAAVDTVFMLRQWMDRVYWLRHLAPSEGEKKRDQVKGFDVAGSDSSRSKSVTAIGIEGQLPNLRAHVIYPDDVETPKNTETVDAREKLDRLVREFDAIASYGRREVCFIGTYHHEESLYLKLARRGYSFRSYTAVLPGPDEPVMDLAPPIKAMADAGGRPGTIVFPHRKTPEDIARHQAEGRSHWLMQYVLCSSTGDVARYPLRLNDLIVPDFELSPAAAPLWVKWGETTGNGMSTIRDDIPCRGFTGDHIRRQVMYSQETRPMQGPIAWIDPSGRGEDETTCTIVGFLSGYCYCLAQGAWLDGYDPATLDGIVRLCRRFRVNAIHSEDNFGGGMFAQLLRPVVQRLSCRPGENPEFPNGWNAAVVEPVRSVGQKERRICDILEPITQQHRLVIAPEVIRIQTGLEPKYTLQEQITRLTRQPKALRHDDRVEGLAAAVAVWTSSMDVSPEAAATRDLERKRDARIRQYLKRFRITADEPAWFKAHPTRSQ